MKKGAFFGDSRKINEVYGQGRKKKVAALVDLYPAVISTENFAEHADNLRDLEVIFSTWGMPLLSRDQLEKLPKLEAVFYAAGTVKYFAQPLLESGVTVVSAWAANAIATAEFALAQILLANKDFFRNMRECSSPETRARGTCRGKGNFGQTVAILGAGMVGRTLISLLKNFDLNVVVYHPSMSDSEAEGLGVKKVTLDEAFGQGCVVTNHLPDLPATRGLLTSRLFEQMRDGATFINTGRGPTVVEEDLIRVLKKRPSLAALLDVTCQEPPPDDSELYTLANVHMTSHIAGSIGDEVLRMADYAISEFEAWEKGDPLKYEVTLERFDRLA